MQILETLWSWRAHAALASAELFFSIWHVVGKEALDGGISPLIFALYREFAACTSMIALAYFAQKGKKFEMVRREDWPIFVLVGFCSFLNVVGFVEGLSMTSPTTAAALQPSVPVFAAVLSYLLDIERFNYIKALGIAAGVSGAVTIVMADLNDEDDGKDVPVSTVLFGNAIIVVQCMGMAVVVVMVKPLLATKRYSSTMITAIYYSIGAIFTALAATPAVITNPGLLSLGGEAMAWIALVYATYFATVINYNIFTWATITTSTATVSLYATLQPLFTGVISILLGARITALTGGFLVIVGLALTLYGQEQMKKEELGNEIMNSHDGSSDVTGLVHEVDVEQVNRTTGGSSKMKKDIFGPGSEYDDVSEPLMSMVDSNGENTNSRYYQ